MKCYKEIEQELGISLMSKVFLVLNSFVIRILYNIMSEI